MRSVQNGFVLLVLFVGCNANEAIHPTANERREASEQKTSLVGNNNQQTATTTQIQNTTDSKMGVLLAYAQLIGQVSALVVCIGLVCAVGYAIMHKAHSKLRKKNGRASDQSL